MNEPTKIEFDFSKNAEVVRGCQIAAAAAVNQTLPLPNIIGLQRALNGVMRLAELQLRYEMFKKKIQTTGGGEGPTVALLEKNGQGT
jgi:hypothetical protein